MKTKCKKEGCYEPADCSHGYCGQHCSYNHSTHDYHWRRKPRCPRPHVGLEVEVEFDCSRDRKRAISLPGASYDGSLSDCSAEFKLLSKENRAITNGKKLLAELWVRRARVSGRCGLHVHLDARMVSHDRRLEVMGWLMRTQEVWYSMIPARRRESSFVRRIKTPSNCEHYVWAHFTAYRTLEVRLHPGTINPHKLEGWLSAMIHLANWMRGDKPFPSTGDAAQDFWALFADAPREAQEYLHTRMDAQGVVRDYAYESREEVDSCAA